MEHDGALRAEPVAQVGQARELVSVARRDVSTRLQQVLAHVVPEILQQSDLKDQRGKRGGCKCGSVMNSVRNKKSLGCAPLQEINQRCRRVQRTFLERAAG